MKKTPIILNEYENGKYLFFTITCKCNYTKNNQIYFEDVSHFDRKKRGLTHITQTTCWQQIVILVPEFFPTQHQCRI